MLWIRLHLPYLFLAMAATLPILLLGDHDPFWSDWGEEASAPVAAAMNGDFGTFLESGNGYIASLLLRMPLFLAVDQLGGDDSAAFYASIAVSLLALAGLTAWLLRRAHGVLRWPGVLLVAGLTVGNPLTGAVLTWGHPEDILAAACMIAGVLLAARGRSGAAGVLIGVAIVSKQWAVLAVLPALATVPAARVRLLAGCAGIPLLFMLPFMLHGGAMVTAQHDVATSAGTIWRSHQIFWPLGVPDVMNQSLGPSMAPDWLNGLPRLLIVGLSVPLSLLWWRKLRKRDGAHPEDVLLLLALLLLARCAMDPWNIDYYHFPFVLTLVFWEVLRRRKLPVLSLMATAGTWFSFNTWPWPYGDATYAVYMAWILPLAFVMARTLLFPNWRPTVPGGSRRTAMGARSGMPKPTV